MAHKVGMPSPLHKDRSLLIQAPDPAHATARDEGSSAHLSGAVSNGIYGLDATAINRKHARNWQPANSRGPIIQELLRCHHTKAAGNHQRSRWRAFQGTQEHYNFGHGACPEWVPSQLFLLEYAQVVSVGLTWPSWRAQSRTDHNAATTLTPSLTTLHVSFSVYVMLMGAHEKLSDEQEKRGTHEGLATSRKRTDGQRLRSPRHNPEPPCEPISNLDWNRTGRIAALPPVPVHEMHRNHAIITTSGYEHRCSNGAAGPDRRNHTEDHCDAPDHTGPAAHTRQRPDERADGNVHNKCRTKGITHQRCAHEDSTQGGSGNTEAIVDTTPWWPVPADRITPLPSRQHIVVPIPHCLLPAAPLTLVTYADVIIQQPYSGSTNARSQANSPHITDGLGGTAPPSAGRQREDALRMPRRGQRSEKAHARREEIRNPPTHNEGTSENSSRRPPPLGPAWSAPRRRRRGSDAYPAPAYRIFNPRRRTESEDASVMTAPPADQSMAPIEEVYEDDPCLPAAGCPAQPAATTSTNSDEEEVQHHTNTNGQDDRSIKQTPLLPSRWIRRSHANAYATTSAQPRESNDPAIGHMQGATGENFMMTSQPASTTPPQLTECAHQSTSASPRRSLSTHLEQDAIDRSVVNYFSTREGSSLQQQAETPSTALCKLAREAEGRNAEPCKHTRDCTTGHESGADRPERCATAQHGDEGDQTQHSDYDNRPSQSRQEAVDIAIEWLQDNGWPTIGWHGGAERVNRTAHMPSILNMNINLHWEAFETAVLHARQAGILEAFTEGVSSGKYRYVVNTMCQWSQHDPSARYSLTVAGATQQAQWRLLHGLRGADDFGQQWHQFWISSQLKLPQLIHGEDLGAEIARWEPGEVAEHAVATTLLFSPTMLHVLLSLQAKLCRVLDAQRAHRPERALQMEDPHDESEDSRSASAHGKGKKPMCITALMLAPLGFSPLALCPPLAPLIPPPHAPPPTVATIAAQ